MKWNMLLKINVFTLTKHFHKLSRKIAIKLHQIQVLTCYHTSFFILSLLSVHTHVCVYILTYICEKNFSVLLRVNCTDHASFPINKSVL